MSRLVHVSSGLDPNLPGQRTPDIYGHEALAAVGRDCRTLAAGLGSALRRVAPLVGA